MEIVSALMHPDEPLPLLQMKLASRSAAQNIPLDPHLAYCYRILLLVSRSFAIVIQQLTQELRDAVCVFYIVLRALDTVEDDMSIDAEEKIAVLREFYVHLEDPSWQYVCGEKHYRELMKNFEHVSEAFLQLSQGYRSVISDITMKMGHGMADFICREVETVADYDKYCYYVAGLVGVGLTGLFNMSGLEILDEKSLIVSAESGPAVSMGRFLQKVNIIRDYLEDINEMPAPRMFWPREIWGKYAPVLADFKQPENEEAAVSCLNEMISDCLRHVPECLEYMSQLHDPSIFRFCAIPQIMAIATAEICYNNKKVFKGVVKIRRGIAAKILSKTSSMKDVSGAFYDFTTMLASKVKHDNLVTRERIEAILSACRTHGMTNRRQYSPDGQLQIMKTLFLILLAIFIVILPLYLSKS